MDLGRPPQTTTAGCRVPRHFGGHLGVHLGLSGNYFQSTYSWHFARGLFEAILRPLGAILGSAGGPLGPSWGRSWSILGAMLGGILGSFGTSFNNHIRGTLHGGFLRPSWGLVGPSWDFLVLSWKPYWVQFGGNLGTPWGHMAEDGPWKVPRIGVRPAGRKVELTHGRSGKNA